MTGGAGSGAEVGLLDGGAVADAACGECGAVCCRLPFADAARAGLAAPLSSGLGGTVTAPSIGPTLMCGTSSDPAELVAAAAAGAAPACPAPRELALPGWGDDRGAAVVSTRPPVRVQEALETANAAQQSGTKILFMGPI